MPNPRLQSVVQGEIPIFSLALTHGTHTRLIFINNDSIDNKIFLKKFQVSKILSPKVPRKHLYIPTIWQNLFFIPKLFLKMPFTEILRINHVEYLFLEVKLKKNLNSFISKVRTMKLFVIIDLPIPYQDYSLLRSVFIDMVALYVWQIVKRPSLFTGQPSHE